MRPRELHSDYYRDRWSESDLCNDFPGDEILIDGLHAMQTHMWKNGVCVDIPVVRVMNTVHFLAAYMMATTCSGDQLEYDSMADLSLGQDKQLFKVVIIVLAAMLARTEGYRARQCRNLILENRDPDFEEGVTLYDRFLRSAEQRFAEEDFLIDTHTQIQRLTAENERLTSENIQLKYTLTNMKKDKSQTIVYNYGTYNDIHDNPYSNIYTTAPTDEPKNEQTVQADEPEPVDSIIFTKKAKKEGKEAVIIEALKNSVQGRKDKTRAFVDELHAWQKEQYIDAHYNAKVMYDELEKIIPISFSYNAFRKYYNTFSI